MQFFVSRRDAEAQRRTLISPRRRTSYAQRRDFNRPVQNILWNFLSHAEAQRRKEERYISPRRRTSFL
jgi:hypothetical protein